MNEEIPQWIGFEVMLRRFKLKGKIINKEPLHVGVGRTKDKLAATVDLPIITMIKDGREVVYIPGSSLKGVFRSASTMLVRTEKKGKYKNLCSGISVDTCGNRGLSDNDYFDESGIKVYKALQIALERHDRRQIYEILWNNYCLMCKVYGGLNYSSHVYIGDAYSTESVKLVKKGIAINRRSGTAAKGALYQIEFVPPGTIFDFELRGVNLPNYAMGLIFKTIDLINNGVYKIGGFKSRGFGMVKIKDLSLEFYGDGKALDHLDKDIEITEGVYKGEELEKLKQEFINAWVNLDAFP